jgi:hypothetical protein
LIAKQKDICPMKKTNWIYVICALTLFSAQQTHKRDADKPDYSRSPAMIRPVDSQAPRAGKDKATQSKKLRASRDAKL